MKQCLTPDEVNTRLNWYPGEINMSYKLIDDEGFKCIIKSLNNKPQVTHLLLRDSGITNDMLKELASGLVGTNVRYIDFSNNGIGPEGLEIIKGILQDMGDKRHKLEIKVNGIIRNISGELGGLELRNEFNQLDPNGHILNNYDLVKAHESHEAVTLGNNSNLDDN